MSELDIVLVVTTTISAVCVGWFGAEVYYARKAKKETYAAMERAQEEWVNTCFLPEDEEELDEAPWSDEDEADEDVSGSGKRGVTNGGGWY